MRMRRNNMQPHDHASPEVYRLRLWLCDLDRNLSTWEMRRQESLQAGKAWLAAECLTKVDRYLEQQHEIRRRLRAALAGGGR